MLMRIKASIGFHLSFDHHKLDNIRYRALEQIMENHGIFKLRFRIQRG